MSAGLSSESLSEDRRIYTEYKLLGRPEHYAATRLEVDLSKMSHLHASHPVHGLADFLGGDELIGSEQHGGGDM
jgi:hypothetical protein